MCRFCVVCNVDISHRRKDALTCDSKDCKLVYRRQNAKEKYPTVLIEKPCKYCSKLFTGTRKSVCCQDCLPTANALKVVKTPVKKELICKSCGKFLDYVYKLSTAKGHTVKSSSVCSECLMKSKEIHSLNKKLSNPNRVEKFKSLEDYNLFIDQKRKDKAEQSRLKKEKQRENMRTNNPMFNPITKEKVQKTLRESKIEGRIVARPKPPLIQGQ